MVPQQELWLEAPEHPVLMAGDAHIWRVYLNQDGSTIQRSFELLSADERQRASKYHFQRDYERFVLARGALRMIVSRYMNLPPEQICFSLNPYGKPALSHGLGADSLHFNLTHSENVALCAFTSGREIGIDIEYVAKDGWSLELADSFFSPTEASTLRGLALHLRTTAFFDCWTRKEAYIKAHGSILSFAPLYSVFDTRTTGLVVNDRRRSLASFTLDAHRSVSRERISVRFGDPGKT